MLNVHERTIAAPAHRVGALLDQMASDDDRLWPSPAWLPMRFDRPLQVGADGGHGDVRYTVSDYEPGRRIEFTFQPGAGLDGRHELVVESLDEDRCVLRHILTAQPRGLMRILTPIMLLPLHNALLEDLLDNAEIAATGRLTRPARWSPWVRLWRGITEFPKPTAVSVPAAAALAREVFDRIDFADAWQVPLRPGLPVDPQVWVDATFADPPRAVAGLMWLRNHLVRLVGIRRETRRAFDVINRTEGEVLLGTDSGHLDFRASMLVDSGTVTLTTVTRINNRRGRFYMAFVSRIHPMVVRRMLRRGLRKLSEQPKRAAVRT
ncbi:DUF2867 domain-containing protein [Phytoactinopolyspora limicola]|uniref:DUF2867 domain-containing protein n=1 Tax=Phytoactinopolyspora limicola TaxID=2715536 RepID=UPI001A9C3337|nr:DUF2867 domain-containing protein [Phytoactinopolyspora limicola]